MLVRGTSISCGICELSDVGNNPTIKNLKKAIQEAITSDYGIMLASLAEYQGKTPVTKLEKVGFKRVGKWKINPNSGNRIALFMKRLAARKNNWGS